MSVGKRIYLKRHMPDPALVEEFKHIPASNTADVMGRSSAMNPRIHLVSSPKAQMMAGPAFTVKCRAGDKLALHAALNYCSEGDVLVVSNEEDSTRSLMGEVMMAYLYLQPLKYLKTQRSSKLLTRANLRRLSTALSTAIGCSRLWSKKSSRYLIRFTKHNQP